MSKATVNGVQLYYELSGSGQIPIVLIHGAWSSHHTWDALVPHLTPTYRLLTYDLRGHTNSERPPGQGSIQQDMADLAALIRHLDLQPVWLVGNSYGGLIAARMAGEMPDLLRGISAHEPPALNLVRTADPEVAHEMTILDHVKKAVADEIDAGDNSAAAEQFIELVTGPGSWAELPPGYQQLLIHNTPTYLDMLRDPQSEYLDPAWLGAFEGPVLLTRGDAPTDTDALTRSSYEAIAAMAPAVSFATIPGAGHVPQRSHSAAYAALIDNFISAHSGP